MKVLLPLLLLHFFHDNIRGRILGQCAKDVTLGGGGVSPAFRVMQEEDP